MNHNKYSLKEKAARLKIEPSERVWNRLESRLDQDKGKIKITTVRKWITVAASVTLIVAAFVLLQTPVENQRQMVLQELDPLPTARFASYRYASQVNAIYERDSWKQISEGTKSRLRKTNSLDNAPVLNQEDSL
ncbi:MAG: hypothetical protein HKN76_13645 [Saprospiraceae bacterium]|nr:hypothetical protein [Saprospiraceae bacterium]